MNNFFDRKQLNLLKKKIKKWLKNQNNQFLLIAFFFLFMQFFIFLGNYKSGEYDVFFWLCNNIPLFFGFAFLLKKINFIKGLINIGFLGQFIWTIDFLGIFLFNYSIFNMTAYVFENQNGLWVLLPIGIHIFATNIALLFTYDKKPNKYTLFYSLIYILFLYTLTLIFTNPQSNINWIFNIGGTINYTHSLYTNSWPLIVFFVLALPTQLIQYLIYKNYQNKKDNKIKK
ncbi:MAG: hypothetical protein ACOC16_00760 [Nanoarchaeota archaeon]